MKRLFLFGSWLLCMCGISAQEIHDSLHVHFETSSFRVDTLYMQNNESLSSFFEKNLIRFNDTSLELKKVEVVGSASPDGVLAFNEKLALRRAHSLADYIKGHLPIDEQLLTVTSVGADWHRLTDMVTEASHMPNQKEILRILQAGYRHNERLWRLKQVNRRIPYRWMYKNLFPLLRQSRVVVFYEVKEVPELPKVEEPQPEPLVEVKEEVAVKVDTTTVVTVEEKKPAYWALKTNTLYDLVLIPNVGVEVYVGKQWSVAANGMYAWWSNRGSDKFWRIYGGDVEVRRWLGKKAAEKPLQGHHVGVYGQLLTYDMTFNGRGYLGDKWSYAFGLSYGYSLPIARKLNLDFNIGIGYMGGKYKEYKRIEGHSVWQTTKNRQWFGPTKAEVSLVWLLGYGNENKQKGGCR